MQNSITPFGYEDKLVRVVTDEESGESLWVAKDICEVLEYKEVSKTLSKLDDDEKGTKIIRTHGGNQEMLVINESGLYTLILRSNKPEAKKFKKWVTAEVLPSIRKTGSYSLHVEQDTLTDTLIDLVRNQQRQTDTLIELSASVLKLVESKEQRVLPFDGGRNPKIDSIQKHRLREAIQNRAEAISKETGMSKKSITPGIWVAFKNFFDLSDYTDLEVTQLTEAMNWVMFYEPRSLERKNVFGGVK